MGHAALWLALVSPATAQEGFPERLQELLEDWDASTDQERNVEFQDELWLLLDEAGDFPEALAGVRETAGRALLDRVQDLGEEEFELLELVSEAVAMARPQDQPSRAYWEWRKAAFLRNRGRFAEAFATVDAALDQYLEAGGGQRSSLLLLQADLNFHLGNFEEALLASDRAVQEGERDPRVEHRALMVRAKTLMALGLPDQAYPSVQQALRQAKDWRRQPSYDAGAIQSAQIHAVSHRLAIEDYEGAVALVREFSSDEELYANSPEILAYLRLLEGQALSLLQRKDPSLRPQALAVLRSTLEEPTLRETDRAEAELFLADLLIASDESEARQRYVSAHGLLESWRTTEAASQPLYWNGLDAIVAGRLALRSDEPSPLRLARDRLRDALAVLLESWSRSPDRSGGVGFLFFSRRRELLSTLIQLERRLADAEEWPGWAALMQVQGKGSLARALGAESVSPDQVRQEMLAENQGLLMYVPSWPQTLVLVMDREQHRWVELAEGWRIERARRDHHQALSSLVESSAPREPRPPSAERERRAAHQLADLVLPAAVQAMWKDWEAVTVVGADVFGPLLFDVLPTSLGEFLGAERAVSYLPSIPVGAFLARSQGPDAGSGIPRVALFSGARVLPKTRVQWPELSDFSVPDRFLVSLRKRYGSRMSAWTSEETRLSHLEARLHGVDIAQFLIHTVQDRRRERPTGLLLGPRSDGQGNELAWCTDVEQLAAPPLVIMTSCQSGVGRARSGDSFATDLAGAWLHAGSHAVLVSPFDLRVGEALEFSESFHQHLGRGQSTAKALMHARQDQLSRSGSGSAAQLVSLQLVGNGNQAFAVESSRSAKEGWAWWPRLLGGLGVLSVIAVVWKRSSSR